MTPDDFEALVRRAEDIQRRDPDAYRRRLLAMALLGFGYIGLVLTVTLALIAGVIAVAFAARSGHAVLIKVLIVLGLFAFMVLRALWVRLEAPWGLRLRRDDAPALFALVDEVRRGVRAPAPHVVLLNEEFNAAVSQVPRLGVLGWHRNYLVLGLPLLRALPPEELRCVLAHEFGHLANAHGRFGAWIYRVRATWARLYENFEQPGARGAWVFRRFTRWFSPRFAAWSFAAARAQEYEADRAAAALGGARPLADALTRLQVVGETTLRPFWEAVMRRASDETDPPASVYSEMSVALSATPPEEARRRALESALRRAGDVDDSHPPLADRLRALGQTPRLPPPVTESAASRYVGELASKASATLDAMWIASTRDGWRGRHEQLRATRERIAALDAEAGRRDLTPDELFERARGVQELEGDAAALTAFESVLAREPSHAPALFFSARIRLDRDDESGLGQLRRAMSLDASATMAACDVATSYLMRHGRPDEARAFRRQLFERGEIEAAAEKERDEVPVDPAKYGPHALDAEGEARIRTFLEAEPRVKLAVLAERRVEHLPERRTWALLVVRKTGFLETESKSRERSQALLHDLAAGVSAPGELRTWVFNSDGASAVKKLAKKVPGALVVRR